MPDVGEILLSKILDAVPGGVVQVEADGSVAIANRQAQRFLGLAFDRLTERYIADWTGETYREDGTVCPVEEYPVARCLATGQEQPSTTIGVKRPGGDIRWAVFSAIPVELDSGRGAVVTFVDITERMLADAERERLRTELAQSARLASIGTLAAGVAHEVNNPLTYILLSLDGLTKTAERILERGPAIPHDLVDDAARLLAQARDASDGARRVRDIVRDLMTFAGKKPREQQKRAVDLNGVVHTAVKMARHELTYRARLRQVTEGPQFVYGSEGRLAQVVLNLLLNAARSIEEGNVEANEVSVSTGVDGDFAVIEIRDTGCGIAREHLDRLFEPFFSARQNVGGSGLGLSICHTIVREHGGRIDVKSNVGVGSTFTVRLPLALDTDRPAQAPQGSEHADGSGMKRRVLLVEDEAPVRRALRNALRGNYDVVEADSYASARRIMEADRAFDLVLSDMMMLDGSGEDVHRWIVEHAPDLEKRMVLMTGGSFTPRAQEFVSETRLPTLYKPFELRQLEAVVRELEH